MAHKFEKEPLPYPIIRKCLEPCGPSHAYLWNFDLTIFFPTNSRHAEFSSPRSFKKPCAPQVTQTIKGHRCKSWPHLYISIFFGSRLEFEYKPRWITPLLRNAIRDHSIVVLMGNNPLKSAPIPGYNKPNKPDKPDKPYKPMRFCCLPLKYM